MWTQIRGLKLIWAVAFLWTTTRQAKHAQGKGTVVVNYSGMCMYGYVDPKRCPEFVCPDRCPDFYDVGDPTLNSTIKETCVYDCSSPTCLTSCRDVRTAHQIVQCQKPGTRCYGKWITCPGECIDIYPQEWDLDEYCYIDCDSPHCQATCRSRSFNDPNCNDVGAVCQDPRFVGGDGGVFYFHGKSNESFNLVSDPNLQINGHFIGHRPKGRPRDFTWIQALGILFHSHIFSLEATKAPTWDAEMDHLKFTYNGENIIVPGRRLSGWYSPDGSIQVERMSSRNNVKVTLMEKVEILVNVVPITKKDNKIHNYQLPSNDCFAHLEEQFRFLHLSPIVDGVLGRTYRIDFESSTKFGDEMPTLGDHEKYRVPSILSPDCQSCVFSHEGGVDGGGIFSLGKYPTLNCSASASAGHGIMCKK